VYEVELKVRAAHDPVRDRLRAMEADDGGAVQQRDRYYDAPHRSFADRDEALRVRPEAPVPPDADPIDRRTDTRTLLTHKGPRIEDGSKTRREVETEVANADAIEVLLEGLGFEPAVTVEKRRDRYRLNDVTVSLDTVDALGSFVEVETKVQGEGAIDGAETRVRDRLTALGLDPESHVPDSYLELLLAADEPGAESETEAVRNV